MQHAKILLLRIGALYTVSSIEGSFQLTSIDENMENNNVNENPIRCTLPFVESRILLAWGC